MSGPTRRVDRGRWHEYYIDGQRVIGVTTAISGGIPKPQLQAWSASMAAEYAYDNQERLTGLDRPIYVVEVRNAAKRYTEQAAARGTELHQLAAAYLTGQTVQPAEGEISDLFDQLEKFVDRWQPQVVLAEATVINRTCRYAGTLDLIADLDGERWLLDFKTGRSGAYGEVALQLAAYRYAETYLTGDVEQPMPEVSRCGVVWVQTDHVGLYPVTAGPQEFRLFRYAQQIAAAKATLGVKITDGMGL